MSTDEPPKIEEEIPPEEETQQEQQEEKPQTVVIQTPLDRPEFDWFLNMYMRKLGITDRKQAAISLTNLFYDMGLDPTADLQELQENMKQVNMLLKNLPNTPASMQVKDQIGAAYAMKAGQAALQRIPSLNTDASQDKFEKMMDKWMPYIIFMKSLGSMITPENPQQNQPQQTSNNKTEIPEEYKREMEAIKTQLSATQELLKQQAEERREKEFAATIINTVQGNMGPQIDTIRGQLETLSAQLNQKALEPQYVPQQSTELKEVSQKLTDLADRIGQKAEQKQLNLADMDTVLSTVESIEKRLKKETPPGEFDWKSATVSTLGEIGKEVVGVFKDIQQTRPPDSNPQSTPKTINQQAIVKRQMQGYILQKISAGQAEMDLGEAANTLGITMEEANWAYNLLINEGWIKPKPGQAAAAQQQPSYEPGESARQPPQLTQPQPQGDNQTVEQPFKET